MEYLGAVGLMARRFEDWPFSWSVSEISDRHTISLLDQYPMRLLCMRRATVLRGQAQALQSCGGLSGTTAI